MIWLFENTKRIDPKINQESKKNNNICLSARHILTSIDDLEILTNKLK